MNHYNDEIYSFWEPKNDERMRSLGYSSQLIENGKLCYGGNGTRGKPAFIARTPMPEFIKAVKIKQWPYPTHQEISNVKRIRASKKGADDGFRFHEKNIQ